MSKGGNPEIYRLRTQRYHRVMLDALSISWILLWSFNSHAKSQPFKSSCSEKTMTKLCEMEIFNFLWFIWDHYLTLVPK